MKTQKNTEWLLYELLSFPVPIQIVLGQAGTGKSYLIRKIKNMFDGYLVLCATTGKAAVNIGGKTIHRTFGLNVHREFNPDRHVLGELQKMELLIVDEVSMCSASLIKKLSEILCEIHKNKVPFGGIKVILFGDMKQLPPVPEKELGENDKMDISFYTYTIFRNPKLVRYYNLNVVHRQEDIQFKEILARFRDDQLLDSDLQLFNSQYTEKVTYNSEYTYLCAVKNHRGAKAINDTILEIKSIETGNIIYISKRTLKKKQKIHGLNDHIGGFTSPDEDRDAEIPKVVKFSIGCPVMFHSNDCITRERRKLRWTNGTMGKVVDVIEDNEGNAAKVIVDVYDTETGLTRRETVEKVHYPYEGQWVDTKEYFTIGKYLQFPFTTAYAMTIDKSQGQTLREIAIVLDYKRKCDNLLYVAVSRVRHLKDIHVEGLPITRDQTNMSHRFDDYVEKYNIPIFQIF